MSRHCAQYVVTAVALLLPCLLLLWDNGVLTDLGIDDGRWGNDPVLFNNRGQIVMAPYMARALLWKIEPATTQD